MRYFKYVLVLQKSPMVVLMRRPGLSWLGSEKACAAERTPLRRRGRQLHEGKSAAWSTLEPAARARRQIIGFRKIEGNVLRALGLGNHALLGCLLVNSGEIQLPACAINQGAGTAGRVL